MSTDEIIAFLENAYLHSMQMLEILEGSDNLPLIERHQSEMDRIERTLGYVPVVQ